MFEILDKVCQPTRATEHSAGLDLYARENSTIYSGATAIVKLGVKIDLNYIKNLTECKVANFLNNNLILEHSEVLYNQFMKSHYIQLHPRSSLRAKGLIIGVGVIDLDFPGELGLIVHNPLTLINYNISHEDNSNIISNLNTKAFNINKGDKIAQCILSTHQGPLLNIESNVTRIGGFGSTDNK